jgi:hypothetical protein
MAIQGGKHPQILGAPSGLFGVDHVVKVRDCDLDAIDHQALRTFGRSVVVASA